MSYGNNDSMDDIWMMTSFGAEGRRRRDVGIGYDGWGPPSDPFAHDFTSEPSQTVPEPTPSTTEPHSIVPSLPDDDEPIFENVPVPPVPPMAEPPSRQQPTQPSTQQGPVAVPLDPLQSEKPVTRIFNNLLLIGESRDMVAMTPKIGVLEEYNLKYHIDPQDDNVIIMTIKGRDKSYYFKTIKMDEYKGLSANEQIDRLRKQVQRTLNGLLESDQITEHDYSRVRRLISNVSDKSDVVVGKIKLPKNSTAFMTATILEQIKVEKLRLQKMIDNSIRQYNNGYMYTFDKDRTKPVKDFSKNVATADLINLSGKKSLPTTIYPTFNESSMNSEIVKACSWRKPVDTVPAQDTDQLRCASIISSDGKPFIYPDDLPEDLTAAQQSDWFFSKLEETKNEISGDLISRVEYRLEQLIGFLGDLLEESTVIVSVLFGIGLILGILAIVGIGTIGIASII